MENDAAESSKTSANDFILEQKMSEQAPEMNAALASDEGKGQATKEHPENTGKPDKIKDEEKLKGPQDVAMDSNKQDETAQVTKGETKEEPLKSTEEPAIAAVQDHHEGPHEVVMDTNLEEETVQETKVEAKEKPPKKTEQSDQAAVQEHLVDPQDVPMETNLQEEVAQGTKGEEKEEPSKTTDELAVAAVEENHEGPQDVEMDTIVPEESVPDPKEETKAEPPKTKEELAPTLVHEKLKEPQVQDMKTNAPDGAAQEAPMEVLMPAVPIIHSNIQLRKPDVVAPKDAATLPTSDTGAPTGLGLLAQYDSEDEGPSKEGGSDTESVVEVPVATDDDAKKGYRDQVVAVSSGSDDSSSDSDSSSDTAGSGGEDGSLARMRRVVTKAIGPRGHGDEDDDEDEDEMHRLKRPPPKVKGEMLLEDLPPIEDLHITVPETECIELGRIQSIVEQLVLVSALRDSVLLDLETVLFLDKGKRVLGEVFDVLGQVADPMYCVRFNSRAQINERDIKVGDVVYVAPKTKYTQFVILANLVQARGSDASWENDVEPPPRYLDYSDDEEEREARAQQRQRMRQNPSGSDTEDGRKRTKGAGDELASTSKKPPTRRGGRGRNASRGGDDGRPRQPDVASAAPPYPPPNYHAGSWHSNYYPQPYGTGGPYMYGVPPPPPHMAQAPYYNQYGMWPAPYGGMQPPYMQQAPPQLYQQPPPPPQQQPPQQQHQQQQQRRDYPPR